eukprot:1158193-Lingulodinium_polyedra.AAC.1
MPSPHPGSTPCWHGCQGLEGPGQQEELAGGLWHRSDGDRCTEGQALSFSGRSGGEGLGRQLQVLHSG